MKKIIYIIVLAISASLLMLSCTEETVAPKTGAEGGGLTSDNKGGN